METRILGRTGLTVGALGLGTEYLIEVPRETVVSVVREATGAGVNYFDVLFAYPHYRDNFGAALDGLRDDVLIAGHLGAAETDGQYRLTRDVAESEALFHDLLARLKTDYVDVLFLSNCDEQDDYDRLMADDGLLPLAHRLRAQGKARFLGFSGHQVPVASQAAASGEVDVLMHTISLSADAEDDRTSLYRQCEAAGVGLVAMKPFAGGVLLSGNRATPVQCLSYALAQPGVSTAVPGVKDTDELRQALRTLTAPAEERDFSEVLPLFQDGLEGTCVYCNHCLPCPSGIDVGRTLRALAGARDGSGAALEELRGLAPGPEDCIRCGACTSRCPFGVKVIPQMAEATALLNP